MKRQKPGFVNRYSAREINSTPRDLEPGFRLFNQYRIPELVGSITLRLQFEACALERNVIGKRAQEFIVAGLRLMGAREDGVYNSQAASLPKALGRHSFTRTNAAAWFRGMFERAYNSGANRYDAPAVDTCTVYGRRR